MFVLAAVLGSSELQGGCAGQDLGAWCMQGCVSDGVKTASCGRQKGVVSKGAFASLPVPACSNNIGDMVKNGVSDVCGPSGSVFSLPYMPEWPWLGWIWDFGVQYPGS